MPLCKGIMMNSDSVKVKQGETVQNHRSRKHTKKQDSHSGMKCKKKQNKIKSGRKQVKRKQDKIKSHRKHMKMKKPKNEKWSSWSPVNLQPNQCK